MKPSPAVKPFTVFHRLGARRGFQACFVREEVHGPKSSRDIASHFFALQNVS